MPSIATILVLQDALDLELHLTIIGELRWWRNEPPSWHVGFEEADMKHIMNPHVLGKLKLIGCGANPLHHLEGTDVSRHELGCSNPFEADVGCAQ